MPIFHFGFFGSSSFRFAYFASFIFVSLMISSFSLRSETSEKTTFFRFEAKSFSLLFRFVSLRTENERRTLLATLTVRRIKESRTEDLVKGMIYHTCVRPTRSLVLHCCQHSSDQSLLQKESTYNINMNSRERLQLKSRLKRILKGIFHQILVENSTTI
jgi:hypothetical protein